MGLLEEGPIRRILRERKFLGQDVQKPMAYVHRYFSTEAWWVLPKFDFTYRVPASSRDEAIKILLDKYGGHGIVIHIDEAWGT